MPKKYIHPGQNSFYLSNHVLPKDWFGAPKHLVWKAFEKRLEEMRKLQMIRVHAFVMMNNHYHLIASVKKGCDLKYIGERLQGGASLEVNEHLQQSFYIFKDPMVSCIIKGKNAHKDFLKYVLRSPVELDLCGKAEDYEFSTLSQSNIKTDVKYKGDELLGGDFSNVVSWINNENEPYWSRFDVYDKIQEDFFKIPVRTY